MHQNTNSKGKFIFDGDAQPLSRLLPPHTLLSLVLYGNSTPSVVQPTFLQRAAMRALRRAVMKVKLFITAICKHNEN